MIDKSEVDIQRGLLIATIVLFIGVGVSILLSYNEYLKDKGEKSLFTNEDAYYILLIDRMVFTSVFIYYAYASYMEVQKSKQNPRNKEYNSFLLLANSLGVLSGLISIFATIKFPTSAESGLEESVL